MSDSISNVDEVMVTTAAEEPLSSAPQTVALSEVESAALEKSATPVPGESVEKRNLWMLSMGGGRGPEAGV